jgi:hypothetical protein
MAAALHSPYTSLHSAIQAGMMTMSLQRSTGGFLIFYQGGEVDHSNNMPQPVAMISIKAEYNEACITCMATIHMHMMLHITLNHIEEVEDESKEDRPIVITYITDQLWT